MMQEKEKKQPADDSENQPVSQQRTQQKDEDEPSYPGKIDQVEGRMHNGELGANLKKEE